MALCNRDVTVFVDNKNRETTEKTLFRGFPDSRLTGNHEERIKIRISPCAAERLLPADEIWEGNV